MILFYDKMVQDFLILTQNITLPTKNRSAKDDKMKLGHTNPKLVREN